MIKIKPNHFAGMTGSTETLKKNGEKYTVRNNRHRYFFPDEWLAFYDALKPRQKVTFHFLINTGARINEIRNVRVQDVDLTGIQLSFVGLKAVIVMAAER